MRKLLYVCFILNIIGSIASFIILMISNFLYALILLPFIFLNLIPIYVLLQNTDEIDNLNYEVSRLRYKLKTLEDLQECAEEKPILKEDRPKNIQTSTDTWKCAKCGTINKPNTTFCSNCKTEYSFYTAIYEEKKKKKKVSRCVKF